MSDKMTFNGFDLRRKIEGFGLKGDEAKILLSVRGNDSQLAEIHALTDENGNVTIVLKG